MTPAAFNIFLTDLLREESIVFFNPPAVQTAADNSRIISWPNPRPVDAQRIASEHTIGEYLADLTANNYTCLLPNGAMLQIEYKWKNSQIGYHRYCYIPAPFDLGEETIRPDEIENLIDIVGGLGLADIRLKTKLRFEFDAASDLPNHPKSHLHIHYPNCRIPVKSSFGVHSFFRFVFRYFCSDRFEESAILRRRRGDAGADFLTVSERADEHISWTA